MSGHENEEFQWRETYFILFRAAKRPALTQVEQALRGLGERIRLENPTADEDGQFESILLHSPDDYAALEICYESGEAVIQQGADLAKELKADITPEQLAQLAEANARMDVMHFEQVVEGAYDDDEPEMLDPTCLLMVVEALSDLTDGIAVDPASGAIMP